MSGRKGYVPWTDTEIAAVRAGVADGRTHAELSVKLGRSIPSIRTLIERKGYKKVLPDGSPVIPPPAEPGVPETLASPLQAKPVTLDELLTTFGLDPAAWDVVECTPNVWQIGAKHPVSGDILTAPLYQLKARVKPKVTPSAVALKAALLADIAADADLRPRVRFRSAPRAPVGMHAAEVDLFDVHVGKMAWAAETGMHYDRHIAERDTRAALDDLLGQATPYPLEEIMLPIGNDFFHSDTLAGATTAGTRMDVDTRFQLMFRTGRGLASWMIARCAEIAPVYVPIIPGNHDEQTAFLLGEVLAAEFARDPRVTIDNSPQLRKYHVYGGNLIGWTHGKDEPHGKLPQIMAVERKEDWGRTVCRNFHVGHLHKSKTTQPVTVDDETGVTVRIIRSLSGTDAWHYRKGYVGGTRGAEAFIYRREGGMRAHLYSSTTPEAP